MVTLISYSLKRGPHPEGLTRKLDVRNVYNPHRNPELAPLTGLDQAVQDTLWADSNVREVVRAFANTMKPGDVMGVRCTHGRHRSVAFVELLARELRLHGYDVVVVHREKEHWA